MKMGRAAREQGEEAAYCEMAVASIYYLRQKQTVLLCEGSYWPSTIGPPTHPLLLPCVHRIYRYRRCHFVRRWRVNGGVAAAETPCGVFASKQIFGQRFLILRLFEQDQQASL